MISSQDVCKDCKKPLRGCSARIYFNEVRGYLIPVSGCPKLLEHAVAITKRRQEISKENAEEIKED